MGSRSLVVFEAMVVLLGILTCSSSPARAQTDTATIYGSVTDPTGAVLPTAIVRLIDIDRGLRTEVPTGDRGFYTFANVRPGRYRMEVEKTGFKVLHLAEITVNVQDNLEQNFRLAVGPASEAITVTADTANVNTTDGTVSAVVDRTFADDIPLNGRSFQTLIMLTPGVVVSQTAYDDQGQFNVNGQRADGNYFTVDGVSATFGVTGYFPLTQVAGGALPALSAQGGTNSLVSVDAMQEFRVQTSSFAPEFGRTPGGQISIVTRSGTNDFQGTLFEYFRNDVLDANDWFNGYTNTPPIKKAEERQNDFGGVFGGPIIKDRSFFFFSYEGLRLRQPSTQDTVVPDDASRQQAPPSMQPYLNAYPVANGLELGGGTAQFSSGYSNPSSLNTYSIRVDHTINAKMSLFGRYNYSPSNSDVRNPYGSLSTNELLSSAVHTFTIGLTNSITPRMINEVRANYSNDRIGTAFTLDSFGGAVPVPDSTLFPSGFTSANGVYEFLIAGVGEWAVGKYGTDEQRQVNLIDNFSWSKASHELKFGVDYRWLSPFSSPLSYIQFAEFGGVNGNPGGALSGTALFADVAALKDAALLTQNLSFYGQDMWKLSPRLTLTYGLRWEINPPLKGKNSENQPYTVVGLSNPTTMTLAPAGAPLYDTTYGNFAPRVGIAYQLGDRTNWLTVLRGGFGIFYDQGYGSLGATSAYFPFNAAKIIIPSSCPPTGNTGVCFPLSAQNAAPPAFSTTPPITSIVVPVPNLKLPRTYEWNVALEQSFGTSQSLSLTYVGAVGRDLLRTTFLENPNPDFLNVVVTDNTATSNYQALQVKFQRRLSQGLQALISYAFSHSIDIASTDAANFLNTPTSLANPNVDRASSDFDIRHVFTAGITYKLPSPQWNNIAHAALGGWSVDSFIFARSAPPDNITSGIFVANGIALDPRPNVVSGVPQVFYGSQYPGGKAFNNTIIPGACPGGLNQVGAWCPVSSGQGDFGRNVLRGFGASQADLAFQRQFHLTERVQLRLRGEFFNIFNHPNFGPPDSTITDGLFGVSTATLASSLGSGGANGGLNPLYQVGGPRSIQFGIKLQF